MTVEKELSSYGEQQLAEQLQPYHEMRTIRDTLEAMLDAYYKKHKMLDVEPMNCMNHLRYAVSQVDDELPSREKLREELIEGLCEDGGNVERYSWDGL